LEESGEGKEKENTTIITKLYNIPPTYVYKSGNQDSSIPPL
jgi:hypothetical protein